MASCRVKKLSFEKPVLVMGKPATTATAVRVIVLLVLSAFLITRRLSDCAYVKGILRT
jgi:hypothetical protein